MSSVALKLPQSAPSPVAPNAVRSKAKILVADDDVDMCELVAAALEPRGYAVSACQTSEAALERLGANDFAAVLMDIHMGGTSGLDLCQQVVERWPGLPVIVITGFGTVEHAVRAIHAGAYDFVTKPVSLEALELSVERAVHDRALDEELKRLRRRAHDGTFSQIVGSGEAIRRMTELIERVATTDTSVLITGESGTGKELAARALHDKSGRKGAFLALNCAAVPENLLESELFGHARGAFTDARVARPGVFVEANDGTLFLDEIGEMPLAMQAKLLRALQERKVRPLGSAHEVPFNARLVTATNRNLEQAVAQGTFREDLFYRVNVVHVDVPPLRARGNDVLELAQFFLARAAQRADGGVPAIGRAVAELLLAYEWPGNVRELENCMERANALARFDTLTIDDLPQKVRDHRAGTMDLGGESAGDMPPFSVIEERYIRRVLDATNHNKTLAAKVLGLDRRTLYRKLAAMT